MSHQALFTGLVYDEQENLVDVAFVGSDAHYVINDNGFRRHIPAADVDRQVLHIFIDQLQDHKEIAIAQALRMMGKDDLFTKAALDVSIRNVNVEEILRQGIPEQARDMMGMMGFRIVIDYHGEVIRLDQPAVSDEGD
ncbi:MAG: hypothetical protein Fur0021_23410 [Candidatus Promineifilaceae bacterium]